MVVLDPVIQIIPFFGSCPFKGLSNLLKNCFRSMYLGFVWLTYKMCGIKISVFFRDRADRSKINAWSFSDTWFTVFVTCGREKIHTVHIIYMYTHNEWQAESTKYNPWGGGLPFTVASSRPHQTHADSQLPTFLQATCLPLFFPHSSPCPIALPTQHTGCYNRWMCILYRTQGDVSSV
jgi:hypothetical protein